MGDKIRQKIFLVILFASIPFLFSLNFVFGGFTLNTNQIQNEINICSSVLVNQSECQISTHSPNYTLDSNANYTFSVVLENELEINNTLEYEWFVCRCKESEGSPLGICESYWPFTESNDTPHQFRETCMGLGRQNITLFPGETKTISSSVSQYQNQLCGSFQTDLVIYSTTNPSCNLGSQGEFTAAGILMLCEDCAECVDNDEDGVCDEVDKCLDTPKGVEVDEDGCDQNQFCSRFSCGLDCFYADWKNDYVGNSRPEDCIVLLVEKEGKILQPICIPNYSSTICKLY